jgi:hypothetical protein
VTKRLVQGAVTLAHQRVQLVSAVVLRIWNLKKTRRLAKTNILARSRRQGASTNAYRWEKRSSVIVTKDLLFPKKTKNYVENYTLARSTKEIAVILANVRERKHCASVTMDQNWLKITRHVNLCIHVTVTTMGNAIRNV